MLTFFSQARATVIKFAQDAEVEDLTNNIKKNVKASEPLEFSKETAYLIRMDKKAPMVVLPIEAARDQIEISGYPLNDIIEMNTSKEVDRVLSDMLVEINLIQSLSRRHQFNLAFQKLDDLQKKYPQSVDGQKLLEEIQRK